jgi:RimJ/RimL family protein N-acetyltransferase
MSNNNKKSLAIRDKIHEIKNTFNSYSKIQLDSELVELVPIDDSDESIKLMTKWRNDNMDFFYSKFESTNIKTKKWFSEIYLPNPNRLLFFIIYKNEKIGHAGIFNFNEEQNSIILDNFVREIDKGERGLMILVELAILKLCFYELKLEKVFVDLFENNFQANLLHKRCGFKIIKKIPLKKIKTNEGWNWIKDETQINSTKFANILEIKKDEIIENSQELSRIKFFNNN